ncbi:MAG: Ser-Thr-rich GPI-anchored membrane family protein, partial [Candidatus Kapaibacterium sp.]
QFPTSLTGTSFCSNQPAVITWNARGISTVDLQITADGTTFTTIATGINALLGTFTWTIPAQFAGGNNLRLRIVDTDRPTTVFVLSGFINVNTPAAVTLQPENKEACLGGTVTLTVRASGTALTYQWEKDGVLMAGRNSPELFIPTVTNGTAGLYRCIINGGSGCPGATSGYALISIIPELTILSQPQSTSAAVGGTAVLRVEANLQSNLAYQWYRGTQRLSDNARI